MNSPRKRPTTTFPTHAFDGYVYGEYRSETVTSNNNDEVADTHLDQVPNRQVDRQDIRQDAQPTVSFAKAMASVHQPEDSGDSLLVQFPDRNPNDIYRPIYGIGQTGDTIISYHLTQPGTEVVAIRRGAVAALKKFPRNVKKPSHKNIARMIEGFYYEKSWFIVYEYMEISLEDITASPVIIHEHHVATICLEILQGLQYMHETLNYQHGSITAASILFSISGSIKIGNTAESLLKGNRNDFQSDLLNLRDIVKFLVDSWSPDAAAFITAMDTRSCAALLGFSFLKKSTGAKDLLPLLHVTKVSVWKGWRFCHKLSAASNA